MMGGDIMPRADYASRDLQIASKHEYVTTEASLLVGVLVMFYMSVILILFGVNVPCFRWRFYRSPPIPNPVRGRRGRSLILEDSIIQEEDEPLKDLQVVAATDHNTITEIASQHEELLDERSLEGITVV